MISKKERVPFWNSFLELARNEAEIVRKVSKGEKLFRPLKLEGETLPDESIISLLF